VFAAVLVDPSLAIVNQSVVSATPLKSLLGSKVFVTDADSGRSGTFIVAGVVGSSAGLGDVIVGPEAFDRLRGGSTVESAHLVSFVGGADAKEATASLSALGGRAYSFSDVARESLSGVEAIARLIRQFALVSVIGSLAMGALVLASSLRDRRRDVASLRTLGASNQVLRSVLGSQYRKPVRQGSVVGALVAVVAAWRLVDRRGSGLRFSLPVAGMILAVVVLYLGWRAIVAVITRQAIGGSPAEVLQGSGA
jgi:hypothetical protein